MTALPSAPVFLILGPPRMAWPEPLGDLVDAGRVRMEIVANVHEAAVHLAGGENGPLVRGLVLDPRILVRHDVEGLAILLRHVALPMVLLPVDEGASPCVKDLGALGVLAWDEAAPAWAALVVAPPEPQLAIPAPLPVPPASADNHVLAGTGSRHELSVTAGGANRYDGHGMNPLVSAEELAALLEEMN